MGDVRLRVAQCRLETAGELLPVWERFRDGGEVLCDADGAPLALAVDDAVGIYRLVCTSCGAATEWFQATPSGVTIQSHFDPRLGLRS